MSTDQAADGGSSVPPALRAYRYKPRTIAFQGVRQSDRWSIKLTVVTVRGAAAHFEDEIEAAVDRGARLLAGLSEGSGDAGVASLIVHVGLAGVWLLLDWWSDGDMLMHRHFFAPLDDSTRFADVEGRHLGPCVWELAVQAHEREAWLRHVLQNPNGPDLDAYLADGFSAVV